MDVSLQFLSIIEKDTFGDVLLTWSYPLLEPGFDKVLVARSGLQADNVNSEFSFSKFKENWVYVYTLNEGSANLPKVVAFSIAILCKTFNPERYSKLTELLARRYAISGQPPRVLQAYLGAYTKDEFDFGASGKYNAADYDDRKALVKCSLKSVLGSFGMESILLFQAMILKKRVIVYCSKLDQLLETIRCLPLFVWHRKNWSILRPYVTPTEAELEELTTAGIYVAGFTDRVIENREDLYDLFIDVDDRSVTVASHAKNDFLLGKPHKEIAALMLQLVEDEASTEQQIIKEIALKTKQFLDTLESLIPEGQTDISAEVIQEQGMPPAMSRFLWNLAIAEGRAQM